jgi:hypothetical protein
MSSAPDHPNLEVLRFAGSSKVRKTVHVAGISPPVVFSVHNSNIDALERAVKERVFYVKDSEGNFVAPPKPASREYFSDCLSGFTTALESFLPSTVPMTRQQFVDTYRGRKQVIYQEALESLLVSDFSLKDSYVKAFIKAEKMNITSKPDPVPRVISPRSPRYGVEAGRYIRRVEGEIYHAITDVFGDQTVMKGLNAVDAGTLMYQKWSSFTRTVAVGLDASRFDQHVSQAALTWEHAQYIKCFYNERHRAQLTLLLNMQLENRCFGTVPDGSLIYTTDGGRMSGDMNTGLGNCLIMCGMIHAYANLRGVTIKLANNGDDCVVFMEAGDLTRFNTGLHDWFEKMGFNMVAETPVYNIEEIEFCQTRPVFVGPSISDYLMVRNPHVAICKDTVSITPLDTEKEFRGWLNAVGTGGLSLTGGIPVWQAFYGTYQKYGKYNKKCQTGWGWGVRKLAEDVNRTQSHITDATRASFYTAFGITPDEQICLEGFYSKVEIRYKNCPLISDHVVLPL